MSLRSFQGPEGGHGTTASPSELERKPIDPTEQQPDLNQQSSEETPA